MAEDDWNQLASWWIGEVAHDPIYALDVIPLAIELMDGLHGRILDLGCGEGQMMRALVPRASIGCDISMPLLTKASSAGSTVQCHLPSLGWLRDDSIDAVVSVLVLELLEDLAAVLEEVKRVTRPRGTFVIVVNHPAYTAEGSGPVVDLTDNEVLWRWGPYFGGGSSKEPAGTSSVTFYHRTMAEILSAAANAGFKLDTMVEHRLSGAALAKLPWLKGHEHFPMFLGLRWVVD